MDRYQKTIKLLYSMLPMFQREGASAYKADLRNIKILLNEMGNPHHHFKSIHIAGTNGKGSTAHILSSLLQENGLKVGLHTSPHYIDFRERIKINGVLVDREVVVDIFEENRNLIDELKPSFFEFTVAMAFEVFRREKVDVAIVETGLGGRLDSTNVIQPLLSIITNIGHDHQAILGGTLGEIAGEKAGIIKRDTPVLIGEEQKETWPVFKLTASANNAPLYLAADVLNFNLVRQSIDSMSVRIELEGTQCEVLIPFSGAFQFYNIRAAIASYKLLSESMSLGNLSMDCDTIISGLNQIRENTNFIGRWQVLHRKPLVVADSAHNAEALAHSFSLIKEYEREVLHIVLGFVYDKDWTQLLRMFPRSARYYCVSPDVPRGLDVDVLQRKMTLEGFKAREYASVWEGVDAAYNNASEYDLIYIVGSSFVTAEAIQWQP